MFLDNLGLKAINQNNFRVNSETFSFNQSHLEFLIDVANKCALKRSRICLHEDNQSNLHQMIVLLLNLSVILPHKHTDKDETYIILDGQAEVNNFDELGNSIRKVFLQPSIKDNASNIWIQKKNVFHSITPISNYVLFMEITNGPFHPDKTINF